MPVFYFVGDLCFAFDNVFWGFWFGGDNSLRETVITEVLFVFEHFFYSVLQVSYIA